MITLERYTPSHQQKWDQFVQQSKNGTFLFERGYMDYHADRFADHSLLFYKNDDLIALLPANINEQTLYSHQGLTYGGLITGKDMRAALMLEVFDALKTYASKQQWNAIHYKAIPHIYHRYPAEEDLYALFRAGATLSRVDVSTSIALTKRWPLHQSKKTGANRAKKAELIIKPSSDFAAFFAMAEARLLERYSTTPVHNASEMQLLASRFPANITLFGTYKNERMIAGTILYISHRVAHTQYISSTEEGRDLRAVDYLIAELIETYSTQQYYFDLGTSNEQQGKMLNTGLISQKEEFGGRSIVHQSFIWNIK